MPFVQFRDPGCVTGAPACVSCATLVWWTSAWTNLTAMLSCADVHNRWVKWCRLVQSWWNSEWLTHPAASRQPHKTALNTTCCRSEQVYWNGTFCFLLRWGSSCSLGVLCPLNSSIFVYHTLAYLHVDSSCVLPVYSNWHRWLTDTRPSSPFFFVNCVSEMLLAPVSFLFFALLFNVHSTVKQSEWRQQLIE